MRLGEVLKEKRVELNLTQEEVGEKLFVTRQTISNWENGKTLPDIVEDVKKKEKLTRLYKWSIIP